MKLHTLKRSSWIVSKSKRLGRWNGSGKGNYSTKGLKGQKSRSGFSMKPFFEWGQTSIVQRIPKARWFKRYFKLIKDVTIVNLWDLDNDVRIIEGMEISKTTLKDLGYIKNIKENVKLLWNGDWTKKVTFVDIDTYSKSAQEKIANPSKEVKKPAAKKAVEAKEEKKPAAKKAVEAKEEKKPAAKKATVKKTSTKKAE
jgi:large subunit ribosomal protein L15